MDSTDIKYPYRTQIVNILFAFLIGLFVIFPDVIRLFDEDTLPGFPVPEEEMNILHRPNKPGHIHQNSQDFKFPPPPEKRPGPHQSMRNDKGIQPILVDFLYFFLLAWGLLLLNNPNTLKRKNYFVAIPKKIQPLLVIGITFIVCCIGIYFNSLFYHNGPAHPNPFPWYLNGILLFKGLFIFVSIVLFGQLFRLLYRQQQMSIENEKLKTESIQNRFDALAAQISPHFLFNSLNSLSGLVRENQNNKALKYINEISNLFRYILKENKQELVLLKEEMLFMKAYQYLLNIKYDSKLSFVIDVNEKAENGQMLPPLSLQPLIENIIKHNIISKEQPMAIKIFIRDEHTLVIENNFQPKSDYGNTTGIGLKNLGTRYKLLTDKEINSYIYNGMFIVELPLTYVH